jgi:NADP-dependent 3-hydroxy acid dehydrogenase YdfG
MGCRDLTRAKTSADKIKAETKNNNIDIEELNLADFISIRDFARRINDKCHKLDVLVNSAGKISSFSIIRYSPSS